MKKPLMVLSYIFTTIFLSPVSATVVYVKSNATGSNNGISWSNAYTSLATALINASDTIWVANGVYPTSALTGFRIWDNQKVFGGFAGTETQLSQRNWTTYQTILDGHDSSRQVVRIINFVDPNTSTPIPNSVPLDIRLDGFKIMRGVDTDLNYPNPYYPSPWAIAGGILVANYAFAADKIVIANCLFTQNRGGMGGAMTLVLSVMSV